MKENYDNRVKQALASWNQREAEYIQLLGKGVTSNKAFLKARLRAYDEILTENKNLTGDEKIAHSILAGERSKLEDKIYGERNMISKLLTRGFRFLGYEVTKYLAARKIARLAKQEPPSIPSSPYIISPKEAGFEKLQQKADQLIQQGQNQFVLTEEQSKGQDEKLTFKLSFQKNLSEKYPWELTARIESPKFEGPRSITLNAAESREINADKAYNLLCGRPIYGYGKFKQIDLTDKDSNGHYKIKEYDGKVLRSGITEALNNLSFKDKSKDHREALDGLLRGGKQPVTVMVRGKEKEVYLETDTRNNSIKVSNKDGKLLTLKSVSSVKSGAKVVKLPTGQEKDTTSKRKVRNNRTVN